MHWIIQDNIHKEEAYEPLLAAVERVGASYTIHKVIPFVGDIDPEVDPDGKAIVIGAYTLTKLAQKRGWTPGAFMDNLDYGIQMEHWGRGAMLNGHGEIYAMKDVPKQDSLFFVRPVSDGKMFTGYVTEWFAFELWRREVMNLPEEDSRCMSGDTPLVVAPPLQIFSETRTWVVKGQVVTASEYKRGSRPHYNAVVEPRIVEFAAARAAEWSPNEAYCMDVADTPNGLKIVEVNCLNASGFYRADMQKLVGSLEDAFG